MALIIKGEMPKNCAECFCYERETCFYEKTIPSNIEGRWETVAVRQPDKRWCIAIDERVEEYILSHTKHPGCPLVEVKEVKFKNSDDALKLYADEKKIWTEASE